jgi:hypothetical protein
VDSDPHFEIRSICSSLSYFPLNRSASWGCASIVASRLSCQTYIRLHGLSAAGKICWILKSTCLRIRSLRIRFLVCIVPGLSLDQRHTNTCRLRWLNGNRATECYVNRWRALYIMTLLCWCAVKQPRNHSINYCRTRGPAWFAGAHLWKPPSADESTSCVSVSVYCRRGLCGSATCITDGRHTISASLQVRGRHRVRHSFISKLLVCYR